LIKMTPDQLRKIYPYAKGRADTFAEPLTKAMDEFGINTPLRQAAFLAQVGHESGQLRYVEEIASGKAYEGRKDLGNNEPGDGVRFKGRGLIQVTGRANYRACGIGLSLPLLDKPELLCEPVNACRSAGWFWASRKLNEFADQGAFKQITRLINGGYNGLDDRLSLYARAKEVLL
jgi:putative chitinase